MLEQWFGIMPNSILYNNELTDKQKLLFCMISSLCAEKWYCRATNKYIGEKLNADERTISRNLAALQDKWYIYIDIENNTQRKITLDKNVVGVGQKCPGEGRQKCPHNNISSKNIKEEEEKNLKEKLEVEYQLPPKVIELAITFDNYKAWPKIRKYDKGQLTRWVNKLKKDGLECEEWMIATLEKSIASWYQWTTPIKPRELKNNNTPRVDSINRH